MQQKDTGIQMKDQLLQREHNVENVASIVADINIPRSTIYSWIATTKEAREKNARRKREEPTLNP